MKPQQYDDHTAKRLIRTLRDRFDGKALPPFWRADDQPGPFVVSLLKLALNREVQLRVFVEVEEHDDGVDWWHLSISGPHGLPSWAELIEARDAFLGKETQAIQILPPASEHVNIHPFCLHLWARVDGVPVIGDLRREGGDL
jgi:hypothetical protein